MLIPSTPAAPLFAFTCRYASHTSRFEISNDLPCGDFCPSTRFLPGTPVDQHRQTTDDPAPSLHPDYEGFTTTTSRSASAPSIGTRSLAVAATWDTPSRRPSRANGIRARLPTFHTRAADQAHAAIHAGHRLASTSGTRQAHPGNALDIPVSMSLLN